MIAQIEVEQEITRISAELERVTHELATLSEAAAHAEVDFKRDYAREFLGLIGKVRYKTVSDREAQATLDTEEQLRERLLAAGRRDAAQEMARTHRAQLSALQTIAANMRALVTG